MLTPQIVLLIGKKGKSIQAIRQSLAAHYQVVLFHEIEKEMAWFDPVAVVFNQNGDSDREVLNQLNQLRQIKPDSPVLLCTSKAMEEVAKPFSSFVDACFSWPQDYQPMLAYLQRWSSGHSGLLALLSTVFSKVAGMLMPAKPKAKSPLPAVAGESRPSSIRPLRLEARFLGGFEVKFAGKPLPGIKSEVNRAMLAYLLYHQTAKMLRRRVLEGFWPSSSEEAARNCLNVAMSGVRRYLRDQMDAPPEIAFRENAYYFQWPHAFQSDVHEFLKLWERGKSLEKAKRCEEALDAYRRAGSLYQGDFLENISRNIEWVESTRAQLKEAYLSILDRLSALLMEKGLCQEAIGVAERILAIDDCIEEVHRRLMICHYQNRRRGKALRQYSECCDALREKLGAEPSEETEQLYRRILSGRLLV